MKMKSSRIVAGRQGFALITTICLMAVALILFASMLEWAFTNSTLTARNNQYNMSQNAAEAAAEVVLGQMDRDFINSVISNSTAYTGLPGTIDMSTWPAHYVFTDTNGSTGNATVALAPVYSAVVPLSSQYTGLSGMVQSNDIYITATPVGQPYNVPATIHESVEFATIPLFQFAIFYNVNLEIDPGAAMTISGPVFCNQSIWEGSSVCTFSSTVTAVGTNCQTTGDPFATSYTGSGQSTFSMAGQPVSHGNALVLPIGTNSSPGAIMGLLGLPPAPYNMGTAQAYSSNGIVYPANGCDLYITNFAWGTNYNFYPKAGLTNLMVYYQDQQAQTLTQVPYDYYVITNLNTQTSFPTNYVTTNLLGLHTNILFAGFSWVTNVYFYDWREGWNGGSGPAKCVQAVQINVTNLGVWLTNTSLTGGSTWDTKKVNHSGHHIGGVYVYDSVPLTTSQLPAVRLINAAQLPNPGNAAVPYGFTVATPFPIYVYGNYNSQNNGLSALGLWGVAGATANTLPAALMGDSITILSTNWSDAITSKMPNTGNTTVNAAMLEGIVASNPAISGNYSGGVENFLRLLENWSDSPTGASSQQTLTYNGSIVVLFYSQYATNSWQPTGNYYNPPHRNWAFDLNFQNPNKLPPMTPANRAIIRGNWYAHK